MIAKFEVTVEYCGGKLKQIGTYPQAELKALIEAQATRTHEYNHEFEITVAGDGRERMFDRVYTCKGKKVVAMREEQWSEERYHQYLDALGEASELSYLQNLESQNRTY